MNQFHNVRISEKAWLASQSPDEMIRHLACEHTKDRLLLLFGVACCRGVWRFLVDERSRDVVELAERFADGQATPEEIQAASRQAKEVLNEFIENQRPLNLGRAASAVRHLVYEDELSQFGIEMVQIQSACATPNAKEEERYQAALLRDILGNPFRPVQFDRSWQTPTTISLSQRMYDDRDFSSMPILADALEETGCSETQIMEHCRGSGTHVRGCWVVDLILSKDR